MRRAIFGCLAVLEMVLGMRAYAGDLYVPGSYTTIQSAVNAATNGDIIYVAAGTYTEMIYINKRIALIGSGANRTIITAYGLGGNAVTFDSDEADNAIISGFTITGASSPWTGVGSGVVCANGADPKITSNIISENEEIGIRCDSSSPTITNNIISKGIWGISCYKSSSSFITNNIITNNSSNGIWCHSSFPTITNNIITNNNHYGIYCKSSSFPSINYNNLWNNSSGNYFDCSSGPNDISFNPQFIGENDYHLMPISLCIDAGNNLASGLPLTDKDGNPRIVNGIVDMGVYEYQFFISSVSPASGPVGCEVTIKGYGGTKIIFISFGTHQTITTTTSSNNGTFSTIFTVNTQFYGTKLITVTNSYGNFATAIFFIIPSISVLPTSGLADTKITIQGSQFINNSLMVISFGTHQTITTTLSNQNGTFSTTFIVSTQPPGTKVITATDTEGNLATTTFILLPPTFLRVIPSSTIIAKNQEFIADVKIDDVRELKGIETHLSFDPNVLEVLELNNGPFPSGGMVIKGYNNTLGYIDYTVIILTGSQTGSGILCSVRFRAKEGGTSSISFDFDYPNNRMTMVKNANNEDIPFNKEESLIYVATGLSIEPEDKQIIAGNRQIYQAYAICGLGLQNVTGSTTFSASGGGSFTANSFLAKYIGTWIITGEFLGLIGTTNVLITPGTPTNLLYISGNNQTANCTETLPLPFVVKVEDSYNNPCPNVLITWSIAGSPTGASGQSLSQTQTLTNINGTTSSYLTLGTEPPGSYTIEARNPALSGSPIIFTAYSLRRFGSISGTSLIDFGTKAQRVSGIVVRLVETGETKTTNADSRFIFANIPCGTYTLSFTYPGATPATKTNVSITKTQFNDTTDIGTITLIMGDPNGDGQINILDWPFFVDSFSSIQGSSTYNPNCDLNSDERINLEDLMIFAANIEKQQQNMGKGMKALAVKSSGGITLKFEPSSIEDAQIGDIINLNILISDAKNSLCGEIHLSYDKDLLEPRENRLQKGNWPTENAYILKNRVENGNIDFAFGLMKPETEDRGTLASISFIIKKIGKTKLSFDFDNNFNRNTMFIERTNTGDQLPNIEQEPIEIDAPPIPQTSILLQSFPNPAKGSSWIPFKLASDAYVSLTIYNITGQKVKTIEVGQRKKGSYTKAREGSAIFFDGKNNQGQPLSSGLYYYKLQAGDFSAIKSMVVK